MTRPPRCFTPDVQLDRVCATQGSYTGAESPGAAAPERSRCANNLMSLATFAAKVFVRSVDHTAASYRRDPLPLGRIESGGRIARDRAMG